MTVKLGMLVLLEANGGKGPELAAFLEKGREVAAAEPVTVTWYAFQIDESHYGIFDTFESEADRTEHTNGELPAALGQVSTDLLATEPDIRFIDIVAVK